MSSSLRQRFSSKALSSPSSSSLSNFETPGWVPRAGRRVRSFVNYDPMNNYNSIDSKSWFWIYTITKGGIVLLVLMIVMASMGMFIINPWYWISSSTLGKNIHTNNGRGSTSEKSWYYLYPSSDPMNYQSLRKYDSDFGINSYQCSVDLSCDNIKSDGVLGHALQYKNKSLKTHTTSSSSSIQEYDYEYTVLPVWKLSDVITSLENGFKDSSANGWFGNTNNNKPVCICARHYGFCGGSMISIESRVLQEQLPTTSPYFHMMNVKIVSTGQRQYLVKEINPLFARDSQYIDGKVVKRQNEITVQFTNAIPEECDNKLQYEHTFEGSVAFCIQSCIMANSDLPNLVDEKNETI